jgi:hypothetical protein
MTTNTAKKDDFEFEVEEIIEPGSNSNLIVEDDTPLEDQNRTPLPKEIVEELENDELEDYSEKVKIRMKQMKKVWHDERREKEKALREHQEAVRVAQKLIEDNKRLRGTLSEGGKQYFETTKSAATMFLEAARRDYKDAYESGDVDRVTAAQEKLTEAAYKINQLNGMKPPLQETDSELYNIQSSAPSVPEPDAKTVAWQKRNTWWGTNTAMTALALGYHQELEQRRGSQYVGSDDYWRDIDDTMRKRFPDYFGTTSSTEGGKQTSQTSKPATVVAPASRSTSSKKIVLKQSQLEIAKKLGITPEQYAREYAKTLEK